MSEYSPTQPSERAFLEARLMHFEDELKYLRGDLSRMEDKTRDDLAEIKALIKESRTEDRKVMDELRKRVTVLEKNKIWLAGWITCASLVAGLFVEIVRKNLGL